jgi:hypothetical protein
LIWANLATIMGASPASEVGVSEEETKFLKSGANRRTENRALSVLLQDPRFQVVDRPTKLRIIDALPVRGDWGIATFDAVMTPRPVPPIVAETVANYLDSLVLVEMKSTLKPIKDANLNGFFFGATEREYALAQALGQRYLFAFVVLSAANEYERPFAVLLSLEDVERRTRARRTQFQVNFRTRMSDEPYRALVLGASPLAP